MSRHMLKKDLIDSIQIWQLDVIVPQGVTYFKFVLFSSTPKMA